MTGADTFAAFAIRKGHKGTYLEGSALLEMGTVRCDGCGEEFVVAHRLLLADKVTAERQAKWLEKVLAEEHERDKKHDDQIELPD